MAASQLTVSQIAATGINPSGFAAANADGNYFSNDDRTYLHAKNNSAGELRVVCSAVRTSGSIPGYGYVTIPDISVTVAASGEMVIAVPWKFYNDTNSRANITYPDGVTDLEVAVFKRAADN